MTAVRMTIRSPGPWAAVMGAIGGVSLAVGGYFIYLAATTNYEFGAVIGWVFGVLFVLEGSVMAALVPALLRPLVWSGRTLRVPKGFKTQTIATDEIAGLGLLYRKQQAGTRTPSGWSAYVFKEDGSAVQLGGAFYAPSRVVKEGDPSRTPRRMVFKGTEDELASTDSAALSQSKPGQLVKQLWDLVAAEQGPQGKLVTTQMQKHSHWSRWGTVSSFWSPDGEMGHVTMGGTQH